jgi:hypothetical protein
VGLKATLSRSSDVKAEDVLLCGLLKRRLAYLLCLDLQLIEGAGDNECQCFELFASI